MVFFAISNILCGIWTSGNKVIFDNFHFSLFNIINHVKVVSLSENMSLSTTSSSIHEFSILKFFRVTCHLNKCLESFRSHGILLYVVGLNATLMDQVLLTLLPVVVYFVIVKVAFWEVLL